MKEHVGIPVENAQRLTENTCFPKEDKGVIESTYIFDNTSRIKGSILIRAKARQCSEGCVDDVVDEVPSNHPLIEKPT